MSVEEARPPPGVRRRSTTLLATLPWMSPPPTYTFSNNLYKAGELLDPLLTATYHEPDKILPFAEALQYDQGYFDEAIDHRGATLLDDAAALEYEGKPDAAATATNMGLLEDPTPPVHARKRSLPSSTRSPGSPTSLQSAGKPGTRRTNGFHLHSHGEYGEDGQNGKKGQNGQNGHHGSRRKNSDLFLSATSDFAPIMQRVTPFKRSYARRPVRVHGTDTGQRAGQLYALLRWPLLALVFGWIALLFFAYVLTRQAVNVGEYLLTWRGPKRKLRAKLRQATTWGEWISTAREMDQLLGLSAWREKDPSGLYDWVLVKKVTHSLRMFRERRDVHHLLGVLDLCLRSNFAGVEGFRLYSETYFGTKRLIEDYVDQVERALHFVEHAGPDVLSLESKRSFYRTVRSRLGTSALCLSGGAGFAYYHFGVARALLDAGLLPRIITGTSAGGLVAALLCTRHDHELDRLLVPELADHITACEESILTWGPRLWKEGSRFDARNFAEKAQFFTMGSTTFLEAYQRTGKMLNISVIPSDRNSPVKLLNYRTAPNAVIWSALLASAAVPGVLQPICLMQKSKTGSMSPMNWGHRFKDGSLRMDIPLAELQSMGVNYPIVSQANPHVHLFFFAPRGMPGRPVAHRKGRGWRGGFLLAALEHFLKLQLSLSFQFLKDLDILPEVLGQDWSSAFLQSFGGTVTIWPKTRVWDWPRILTDPDRTEMHRLLLVGQSVTFPKLHMIENRMRIERAIENVRRSVRTELKHRRVIAEDHNHAVETGIERAVVSGIGRALAWAQNQEPLTDTDNEADVTHANTTGVSKEHRPDSQGLMPTLLVNGGSPSPPNQHRDRSPRPQQNQDQSRTHHLSTSSPLATQMISAQLSPDESRGSSPGSGIKARSMGPEIEGFSGAESTGDEHYVSAPDADEGDENESDAEQGQALPAEDDGPLTASVLAQQPHHHSTSSRNFRSGDEELSESMYPSLFASRGAIAQDRSVPTPPWHSDEDVSVSEGSDA